MTDYRNLHPLRLPDDLRVAAEAVAAQHGMPLDQLIIAALAEKVEIEQAIRSFGERERPERDDYFIDRFRTGGGETPRDDDAVPQELRQKLMAKLEQGS